MGKKTLVAIGIVAADIISETVEQDPARSLNSAITICL